MIHHIRAETDITDHCNLRCRNCCHRAPQSPPGFYPLDDYKRDLDLLAEAIHYQSFGVLGGEPLLNPDCLEYVRYVKASGLADRVEFITNGTLLPHHKDAEAILEESDTMWVSRYTALGPERLAPIDAWCENHKQDKLKVIDKPEFWDMYHPEGQPAQAVWDVHAKCDQWQLCNLVYKGYYYACAPSARWEQKTTPRRVRLQDPDLELLLSLFIEELKVFPSNSCAICQRTTLLPHAFEP